jgi:hypothetical protein
MRAILDIDAEVLRALRDEARRSGAPFAMVVDRVLRVGLERIDPRAARPRYKSPTFHMGAAGASLDKALQLAAQLEDDETLRKVRPPEVSRE